jgi:hypothetical protein
MTACFFSLFRYRVKPDAGQQPDGEEEIPYHAG